MFRIDQNLAVEVEVAMSRAGSVTERQSAPAPNARLSGRATSSSDPPVLQHRHRLLDEDRRALFQKMTWSALKSPVHDATMSESAKAKLLFDIEDVHERQPQVELSTQHVLMLHGGVKTDTAPRLMKLIEKKIGMRIQTCGRSRCERLNLSDVFSSAQEPDGQ